MIQGDHQSKLRPKPRANRDSAGQTAARAGGVAAPGVDAPADGAAIAEAPPRVGWQNAVQATVSGLGYELVDTERAQRGLLRITIDRVPGRVYSLRGGAAAEGEAGDGGESITVEDCEKVTRQLQYVLEVEGLDYARLEVSSPGLDRPLKREADYQRFVGQAVQLVLKQPFKGRKSWQGILTLAAPDAAQPPGEEPLAAGWSLVINEGKTEQVLGFTLDEVREARLVPVINFKGRKVKDSDGAGSPAATPTQDGG